MNPHYFEVTSDLPEEIEMIVMELGKDYEVSRPRLGENFLTSSSLSLPLMHGTRIIVQFQYNGEINLSPSFIDDESMERDYHWVETINDANPIFNQRIQEGQRPNYKFVADYRQLPQVFPSLQKAIKAGERFRTLDVCDVINTVGLEDIVRKVEHKSLIKTLANIYDLISKATSGEEHEEMKTEKNLSFLVKEYLNTGKFSGDCKSVSIFTAGLAIGAGLHARVLVGAIFEAEDYGETISRYKFLIDKNYARLEECKRLNAPAVMIKYIIKCITNLEKELKDLKPGTTTERSGGHNWTEVYVPLENRRDTWFVVDPAFGTFGKYPTGKHQYVAICTMPEFLDQSVKSITLKVDYKK